MKLLSDMLKSAFRVMNWCEKTLTMIWVKYIKSRKFIRDDYIGQ